MPSRVLLVDGGALLCAETPLDCAPLLGSLGSDGLLRCAPLLRAEELFGRAPLLGALGGGALRLGLFYCATLLGTIDYRCLLLG